jgi:hypothetical protein
MPRPGQKTFLRFGFTELDSTSAPNHPPGIRLFNAVSFPVKRRKRLRFTACKKGPVLLQ